MKDEQGTYDGSAGRELSLSNLVDLYHGQGVTRIFYKILSPNDNSKNQPWMASHLTDLGFLPTHEVTESRTRSQKNTKRKIKYFVKLDYYWMSPAGMLYPAPDAKLVYYPQYPEVRLSGFLAKSRVNVSKWMNPAKQGREPGRILFMGVTEDGKILAWFVTPESRIAREIKDWSSVAITNVFHELVTTKERTVFSAKELLLMELERIHLKKWIRSKRLKNGHVEKYQAQNGGGYTLEAELGIMPNGYADPDFMGWEVKQFGVTKCHLVDSKALTLMTPEPDGGYYVDQGVEAFMRKYGYPSPRDANRLDFTGRHQANQVCSKTGLMLVVKGYDYDKNMITDAAGCIALVDKNGNPASAWTFGKLMEHWKRKHAKAVYIPSRSRNGPGKEKFYSYCQNIRLFEGTSFTRVLRAFVETGIYYDPGIKLENLNTEPKSKRRSQFRMKSANLGCLYEKQSDVDLLHWRKYL